MGIRGMINHNIITLVLLAFVNLLLMSAGGIAWTILGLILLAGGLFLTFRYGAQAGHEACSILKTVSDTHIAESGTLSSQDRQYVKQSWDRTRGIKALFASALVPYAASCVYLVMMLLGDGTGIPTVVARIVAMLMALPYWPLVAWKYQTFTVLEWPIVVLLMVSPFVVPTFTYLGYLQGPKLWKKTEEAMVQGKRRAKAKSRIVKKSKPREQKPQI